MKALLALIKKLYGSKALSKTIGTRTNVITLPDKETKRFVSNELNIDAASDAAVKKAYEDVEKLIPDIPKMNDQEILTLTGNLRRLDQRLNPPSAEVISIGTKQPVSPTGIKQLTEQAGQKAPPGTLMGNLESRLNQLRASGKELEALTKGKGMTLEDLLQDPTRSGGPLDPKVGIVRTAAREILEKNLKAGKIDIPDEAAKDAILKSYQGGVDPIDVLRKTYGEGVLEQLDDIADELNKASDYKDIQKILQREKLFEAKPKKTYGYDEGVYSDEEMAKILTDETPDEFATGGRVGYMGGGSTGLDYLMGIDRTNYQNGGMTLEKLQAKAPPGEFLAYINPEEAGVLKALGGSGKKINGIPSFFASGPGDTGGAGGADGAGGNDEGGGGSGDTGDMGSEAANAAATAAGAASVGAGVGPTDPGVTVGSMMGNFGRNVANMSKANPISSMIASAVFGPIGSLALNAAMAYGSTGTTNTTSTNESDGTSDALIQQAIADPLGLNAAARDMSGVNALYNQYITNVGFQSGGRVGFKEGTPEMGMMDPKKLKQVQQMIKMGADVSTISSITGLSEAQINQIQKSQGKAEGGRVGYAYGSGLKLAKLLQKAGTNLKKAIREAIDNINPTGDKKLDADMAVDDMLETYNIDRDAVDGYDILNAYDEAYKTIATPGSKVMFSPAETKFAKDIGATKMAERIEIMEKYPGIDPKLVDKILIDDNPQRKAEILATLDEAFTMMKKGMSDDEILTTIKKTPRTKQAGGGLAYLMGL